LQDVRADKQGEEGALPQDLNRLEVLRRLRVSIREARYATVGRYCTQIWLMPRFCLHWRTLSRILKDIEAALPLLQPLLTLESPVARKQVANAIGQLIGEGDGLYGLLSQEEFGRDSGVANWKLDLRFGPIEGLVGVFQQGPRREPKRHIRCHADVWLTLGREPNLCELYDAVQGLCH
jgi:hypothetical protein